MSATDKDRRPRSYDLDCTPRIRNGLKDWFADLHARVTRDGEPFVIAPAMAPHEILESFDIHYISNEWWSGQMAARQQTGAALDLLEKLGFHAGLPRYSALTLASALDVDNSAPVLGGLPRPSFVLYPFGQDLARAEALADAFGCPALSAGCIPDTDRVHHHWWDVSKWLWEDVYGTARIDCIVSSYRDIIHECERVTGKKFDIDRLREVMQRVADQESAFAVARELQRKAPLLPVSMSEEMGDVMSIQWRRGSEWALQMARDYRDEILARVQQGVGVCPNERVRLGWNGVGLWQATRFYRAFEASHGAVFVRSIYASVAVDGYTRYGLADPLRALASRYAGLNLEISMPPASYEWELHELRESRAHGVVMLPNRHRMRFAQMALEEAGIPTLVLPVDAVDTRTWEEEKLHSLVSNWLDERVLPQVAARQAGLP